MHIHTPTPPLHVHPLTQFDTQFIHLCFNHLLSIPRKINKIKRRTCNVLITLAFLYYLRSICITLSCVREYLLRLLRQQIKCIKSKPEDNNIDM